MIRKTRQSGFTLVELLVVIAIIGVLATLLLPSLASAKEHARSLKCQANLYCLGVAMNEYLHENNDVYWPYTIDKGYFWGTDAKPVVPSASPFMQHCGNSLEYLWCPDMAWGSYMPQGTNVEEPTTTYAYNAFCLTPDFLGRKDAKGRPLPRKHAGDLSAPGAMFIFVDSAMYWPAGGGRMIFQNSTYLEPPQLSAGRGLSPNSTATTHFRHAGKVNALCGDGHAAPFEREGGLLRWPDQSLGWVGKTNGPHYDQ
jgi:prepilin-type N-terminal cleavage/methylation domain-containing protein/prepilin-type processing-associated H-X9-DG protein